MSVNKVILIGNVGRDPEIRNMPSGEMVANLAVATSEKWKDKNSGERKERTEWHRVVIFNEAIAKIAEQYVRKGSRIYIEGALQTRKWTDKDGLEKYATEIVLQRFRGELMLLDRVGGEDRDQDNQRTIDRAVDAARENFGRGVEVRERPNGLPQRPAPSNAKLDDEIPF